MAPRSVTPLIMGVVNASLDSLVGGVDAAGAARLARSMVQAGASVLDCGGQSLRTDRGEITVDEELSRVLPVIEAVAEVVAAGEVVNAGDVVSAGDEMTVGDAVSATGSGPSRTDSSPPVGISIDTYRASVAEAAIAAGATIVNDPSGLVDPDLADVVAATGVDLVLAYSRATPKVRMTRADLVADPLADGLGFLRERLELLSTAGVPLESVVVDPGPDLGKSPEQTIAMLNGAESLRTALGGPRMLWAVSKKDFVGALVVRPPSQRVAGTFGALSAIDFAEGDIVRVHDVAAVADFFTVRAAVLDGYEGELDLPERVRYEPW